MVEKNTVDDFTFLFDPTILADDRSSDRRFLPDVRSIGQDTIGADLQQTIERPSLTARRRISSPESARDDL